MTVPTTSRDRRNEARYRSMRAGFIRRTDRLLEDLARLRETITAAGALDEPTGDIR